MHNKDIEYEMSASSMYLPVSYRFLHNPRTEVRFLTLKFALHDLPNK